MEEGQSIRRVCHEAQRILTLLSIGSPYMDDVFGCNVVGGLASVGPANVTQRLPSHELVSAFLSYDLSIDSDIPLYTFLSVVGYLADLTSNAVDVHVNTYLADDERTIEPLELSVESLATCAKLPRVGSQLIRPPYDTSAIAWSADKQGHECPAAAIRRISDHGEWLAILCPGDKDLTIPNSIQEVVSGLAVCNWGNRLQEALHSHVPHEDFDIDLGSAGGPTNG